jgi:hypothetical protein
MQKTLIAFVAGLALSVGATAALREKLAAPVLRGAFVEVGEDGVCRGSAVYRVKPADAELAAVMGEQEVAFPIEVQCADFEALLAKAVPVGEDTEAAREGLGIEKLGEAVRPKGR